MTQINAPFNRHVGLVILDVTMSNPNGDPDMESDPRKFDDTGKGLITPVSFKRKLRDLVEEDSVVLQEAFKSPGLSNNGGKEFGILESRGRDRAKISNMKQEEFKNTYWDARVFGNTFLENLEKSVDEDKTLKKEEKDEKKAKIAAEKKAGDYEHFIRTGAVQVGVGVSIAKIDVERLTMTNKAGVQGDKDRGMAPLGFRVVRHGIYTIPIYVNPSIAQKTGMDKKDLALLKFLIPHAYQHTASAIRPQVTVLHAWFAEHKNPLGSCPDYKFIDALTPTVKAGVPEPEGRNDYEIPTKDDLENSIAERFEKIEDLCDQ